MAAIPVEFYDYLKDLDRSIDERSVKLLTALRIYVALNARQMSTKIVTAQGTFIVRGLAPVVKQAPKLRSVNWELVSQLRNQVSDLRRSGLIVQG